jgi:imidazolonepropionase-like amidohydrolase
MDDQIGSVEPGKLADLVVLETDPLADVGNLRRVHTVILGGKRTGGRG